MIASIPVLLIIVIFAVVAFIVSRRDRARQYDERQLVVRGSAYQAAYMVTVVFLAAACICQGEETAFLCRILLCLAFYGGLGVFAVYSIWKGSFFRLHQNPLPYTILCFVIALLNAFTTGLRLRAGESFLQILAGREGLNFFMSVLFAVVGAAILVRRLADAGEEG